ncbi:hypothetical protein [Ferrimonas gelatinilytica]|uniref:DUF997 family protein n=1 Tax=Ferrimonas gelatinilytica TaxID=1255257 RepID=A0ABP9S002_9GAMM
MQKIDVKGLAQGAVAFTLGYFILWLAGPLWFSQAMGWWGLPLWFWSSCVAAPLLLSVLVGLWLRGKDDD